MNIPSKIKILGKTYKVIVTDNFKQDGKKYFPKGTTVGSFVGCFDTEEAIIMISSEHNEEQIASTFLHEVMEAITAMLNIKIKHDDLERFEIGLYQVLAENNLIFNEGGLCSKCTWRDTSTVK